MIRKILCWLGRHQWVAIPDFKDRRWCNYCDANQKLELDGYGDEKAEVWIKQ